MQVKTIVVLCGSLLLAAGLRAQTVAPQDQLGDIVVTAQKRSESIQDVPAAVTVASGEALAQLGVTNPTDLARVVPGLVIADQSGTGFVFLRGVGQTQGAPNAQPGVSVNINGVYAPREMGVTPLYDLEQVEALPGPQGTLWGRNAAGGAIDFITKRPVLNEVSTDLTFEAGNYSLIHPTAVVNLPIGDTLAVRVVGDYDDHDGYLSNGSNDLKQPSGRVSVLFEPASQVSAFLSASYTHNGGIGTNQIDYVQAANVKNLYNQNFSTAGFFNDGNTYAVQGELRLGLTDHIDLTYIPGYVDVHKDQNLLFEGNSALFTNETHQWTQELRLSGSSSAFKWVTGLYWYQSPSILSILVGSPPTPAPTLFLAFQNRITGEAAFGDLTYSVTDNFRLLVGGRGSSDRFDGIFTASLLFLPPPLNEPSTVGNGDRRGHGDYKVGAEYDLTKHSMVYATVQSGYLMGGYTQEGKIFAPETLTSYTAGIKNQLLGDTLRLNVEGFYYDYKNYQLEFIQGVNTVVMTEPARIYGVELDVSARVASGTTLRLNALGMSARIYTNSDELFDRDGVQTSIRGYQLPNAPSATITAGVDQEFPLPNGATLVGRGQVYYNSGYWNEFAHDLNTHQGGFTNSDLSLTYITPRKHWNVGAFARNLENNAVLVGANKPSPDLGPSQPFLQPPRTFGVRGEMHF